MNAHELQLFYASAELALDGGTLPAFSLVCVVRRLRGSRLLYHFPYRR